MKHINTIKFKLSTLACLLFISSNISATDYSDLKAYEIEVVIFKSKSTKAAGSETWPDLVTTESTSNSIELHNSTSLTLIPGPDEKAYYYSKIPAENFRLTNEAEKLVKSNEYEVIFHSAWIQPGLDKENAEFIHIQSNENDNNLNIIDPLLSDSSQSINQAQSMILATDQNIIETQPVLDGVIKVELGRYLHIFFDLKYKRDLAPVQGIINTKSSGTYKEIKYYPVQTQRRMRSKEVHYIDHPLIGILVLATRFELPTEDEQDMSDQPLLKLKDVPVN